MFLPAACPKHPVAPRRLRHAEGETNATRRDKKDVLIAVDSLEKRQYKIEEKNGLEVTICEEKEALSTISNLKRKKEMKSKKEGDGR